MDADHGGRVTSPQNFEWGTLMQTDLPQILSQVQKGAFYGLQNTPKSVFGRGSADTPLHPPPHSAPTHLNSAVTMRTPRIPARSTPMPMTAFCILQYDTNKLGQ